MARRSTREEFIAKSVAKYGDHFDYSKVEYVNAFTKVRLICKEFGEFEQLPCNHLTKRGCAACFNELARGKAALTQGLVTRFLSYDQETGHLDWKTGLGPVKAGTRVATVGNHGYLVVSVRRKLMLAHRLIWLMVTGALPTNKIDHINGVRTDNRWENLREVSNRDNSRNSAIPVSNTSGVIGVSLRNDTKKWAAYIHADGRRVSLGSFSTLEEAVAVRKDWEHKLGFHPNHGRPSR